MYDRTVPHAPDDHLDWVRKIARDVCRAYHLQNHDEDPDLEDVASAGVVKLLSRWECFQPEPGCQDAIGAFRGYVFRTVKTACQREAERVINGGTYHCRRRDGRRPVIARAFSCLDGNEDERSYEPASVGLTVNYRDAPTTVAERPVAADPAHHPLAKWFTD